MSARARQLGFTLIELLAVIAILAIVTGVLGSRIGSAQGVAGTLRVLAARCHDLDTRARLLAQSARIRNSSEMHAIAITISPTADELWILDQTSGHRIARLAMPRGVAIAVINSANNEPVVRFDRRGRTDDYSLTLTRDAHSIRVRVSGLTGVATEAES